MEKKSSQLTTKREALATWPGTFLKAEDEMKLTATNKTYDVSLETALQMFADAVESPKEKVSVEYVIQEVGGDPMDRFPGVKKVTAIRITVNG